jgi:hypothetical protein
LQSRTEVTIDFDFCEYIFLVLTDFEFVVLVDCFILWGLDSHLSCLQAGSTFSAASGIYHNSNAKHSRLQLHPRLDGETVSTDAGPEGRHGRHGVHGFGTDTSGYGVTPLEDDARHWGRSRLSGHRMGFRKKSVYDKQKW